MNISANRSNHTHIITEAFKNYPESLLQFAYACCVLLILLGIPGNLITIIALASYKRYRNVTAILIINLHISNLIFCCMTLPLAAISYSEKRWIFSKTVCSMYALMKFSLIATAHFTVAAITINRYILVCHPFKYPTFNKKIILLLSLIGTWLAGFGIFLPSFFEIWGRFDLVSSEATCSMIPTKNGSPKMLIVGFAFAGPYLIMCMCYGQIWWRLRKTTQRCNKYKATNVQSTIVNSVSESYHVTTPVSACPPQEFYSLTNSVTLPSDEIEITTTRRIKTKINSFQTSFRRTGNKNVSSLPTKKDKKLATMIIALIISFTICHLPLMLLRALYEKYKLNSIANILAHLLEYSSACINPVLYVIISSEYRHAYKKLFDKLKTNFKNGISR